MSDYHLDYEGRSKADLKKVGAYRYAEDPSTQILMAGISKDDGPVFLWVHPDFRDIVPSDPEAEALLEEGTNDPTAKWYAWNAQFEQAMSRNRMFIDMGLCPPRPDQWRCVAAMSRRAAMPGKLEMAAKAFSLEEQKDKKGGGLINTFCKPTKEGTFRDPHATPKLREKFKLFCDYCRQDVVVEKHLHRKLRVFEFSGGPLRTFQLDSLINDIGLPVNVPALHNAKRILDEVFADLNDRFYQLTGLMQSQNKAVKALLQSLGVVMEDGEEIENLKAETVKAAILVQETELAWETACGSPESIAEVQRRLAILRLYGELNFAAAKKVYAMLACVCSDGRVRGTLLYHGAGTGRWSGRLIQPQNFKKATIKLTEFAYEMICQGCSREELERTFGNPLEVIASCIRHFIHWDGGEMLDADYNAIEARIVCWLAGQEDVLEMFRNGADLYKRMAGEIYNKPPEAIQNPSHERTVGKHTILGCGFAMWWPKFKETCAKFGVEVSDELAERAVRAYREMCDKVVQLWTDVETAAISAINNPGKSFKGGKFISFSVAKTEGVPYLVMKLPSGRNIVYPWPALEWVKVPVNDDKGNPVIDPETGKQKTRQRRSITFYGQIEGKQIWGRVKTYGGKLVENATQGVAADVMAHGAANAVERGFEVPTLIHDQALALAHPGHSIKDFIAALTDLPPWAAGLPIRAEGKVVPYYMKG